MVKGVQNNHGSDIVCPNITLAPGLNRLTPEQYRELKAIPVIVNYFGIRLLEDAPIPADKPEPEEELPPPPPPPPAEKPLDKMNKAELLTRATELGLTVDPEATNAAIREAITAATAQ